MSKIPCQTNRNRGLIMDHISTNEKKTKSHWIKELNLQISNNYGSFTKLFQLITYWFVDFFEFVCLFWTQVSIVLAVLELDVKTKIALNSEILPALASWVLRLKAWSTTPNFLNFKSLSDGFVVFGTLLNFLSLALTLSIKPRWLVLKQTEDKYIGMEAKRVAFVKYWSSAVSKAVTIGLSLFPAALSG